MRAIIFKGKRVDNGEWVYGAYVYYNDIQDDGKDDCVYIITRHNGRYFPFVKVMRETVGQYTGLIDKNGTLIFEGDIVQDDEGYRTLVEYDNLTGGYEPFASYDSDCGIYNYPEDYEVIGNIHDNPELLK